MSTTNNSNGDANDATDSSDSSPTQSAAAIAARVAAAAAVGIQGIGTPGVSLGPVTSKNIKVPDKMVGLSEYFSIKFQIICVLSCPCQTKLFTYIKSYSQ